MWRGVIDCAGYFYSVFKVSFLISLAFFLPKLWISHVQKCYGKHSFNHGKNLTLGLERIDEVNSLKLFFRLDKTPYTTALITNQSGKDQFGNRNIDLLVRKGIKISYVLVPRRGYHAHQSPSGTDVASDPSTHIPIINWDRAQEMENVMNSIDLLLFDMQDAGLRYGYLSTMFQVLRKASQYNKKVVILDRPNLLGCYMEGSFSLSNNALPIPLRHGMTLGELASYYNKNLLDKPADLVVIAMENYNRSVTQFSSLLCDNVSPNIRSLESCYGYSFLGLLGEISPFDVGLGTDKSFQCLALPESIRFPKQKWYEVRALLKSHGIDSRYYRYYSKRKKRYCSGLTIGIANINQVSSFNTFLDLLDFFNKEGIKLTLSSGFDAALGTKRVREFLEGKIGRAQLQADVNNQLRTFYHHASSSFIYTPLPRVVYL